MLSRDIKYIQSSILQAARSMVGRQHSREGADFFSDLHNEISLFKGGRNYYSMLFSHWGHLIEKGDRDNIPSWSILVSETMRTKSPVKAPCNEVCDSHTCAAPGL
ncbi:uncharacterized protein ACHE_20921A [Aspergillus chevalieri]|uniref:Uncharacterized protein n=1 Tax=Aspergillus chevalieri TaxID=182096 RepID=A0A7R7VKA9_ASPCH|nr:uncharacterized protein ACHE_20921A [Aspergillus chevalieri]BCR85463.1 hypothetical protein ACHE_20921A [Aspergillus chevalieri]